MTIDEAIRRLADFTYGNKPVVDEEGRKAIMLGREGLKRIKDNRENYLPFAFHALPGETEPFDYEILTGEKKK